MHGTFTRVILPSGLFLPYAREQYDANRVAAARYRSATERMAAGGGRVSQETQALADAFDACALIWATAIETAKNGPPRPGVAKGRRLATAAVVRLVQDAHRAVAGLVG